MVYSKLASSGQKREKIAWILVILQACIIFSFLSPSSICDDDSELTINNRRLAVRRERGATPPDMNNHPNEYYHQQKINSGVKEPHYESPIVYGPKEAAFVNRVWRSNGSPSIHSDLKMGSCWCSADDWCMCTPSLAIDLILRSGDDHIWLVRRSDTGLLALMGGFTEVGETSEETVHRELMEEMGISLDKPPVLFGVYNDPRRDSRRRTTSIVYIADIPEKSAPEAGDDATNVIRLPISDFDKHEFFVDHKTIIYDYVEMVKRKKSNKSDTAPKSNPVDSQPFKRSVCPLQEHLD
mmetsp:Transcript_8102/g.17544  ORF Transcript_8102/g.17544 Transcript_8102/m.17544 type:complete len:296 (-) Transcript_8102:60-947(-)